MQIKGRRKATQNLTKSNSKSNKIKRPTQRAA